MMRHIYEGSESDSSDSSDINIASGRAATDLGEQPGQPEPSSGVNSSQNRSEDQSQLGSSELQVDPDLTPGSINIDGFDFSTLVQGELAPKDEPFLPFHLVKKYPFEFIGKSNQKMVDGAYFAGGKLYNRVWDFFYIYRLENDNNKSPITLVPTSQFNHFLAAINQDLGTNLTIPSGNKAFSVTFTNNGILRPRYLGRTSTENKATALLDEIPPRYYRPSSEKTSNNPSQAAIEAFKGSIILMTQTQQASKGAKKEELLKKKRAEIKGWGASIERVQQYIGVRQQSQSLTELENISGEEVSKAGGRSSQTLYNPEQVAPFDQEKDVVFICVDVESYERAHDIITEIGIATLDTRGLAKAIPGEDGSGYREIIRARHFRISEHARYRNSLYLQDCPDKFDYGTSEWISIRDAPSVIASCFKYPFSDLSAPAIPENEEAGKRNIVLVGHDLQADVNYMRKIGYNVDNLARLIDNIDTKQMWQYVTREVNSRKLVSILADLKLTGWHPHNAGNDAVYALHAMLGTAIKHLQEGGSEWTNDNSDTKDKSLGWGKVPEDGHISGW